MFGQLRMIELVFNIGFIYHKYMAQVDYEQILRKLIAGRYYGDFVSMFRWWWIEKQDNRPYLIWDDSKSINRKLSAKYDSLYVDVFHQEKDATLQVFFDVNHNRKSWVNKSFKDIIIQHYLDLSVYCLKHQIFVECFTYEKGQILVDSIGKDKIKAHAFIDNLKNLIDNQKMQYRSWWIEFLQTMKQSAKRRAIMIFSDFMRLDDKSTILLKQLMKDHAIYLFTLKLSEQSGLNYEWWYTNLDTLDGLPNIIIDSF